MSIYFYRLLSCYQCLEWLDCPPGNFMFNTKYHKKIQNHKPACLFHNRLCLVSNILLTCFVIWKNAFRKARNKNQCIMFFLVMSFCQLYQISKLHLSFCCSCSKFSSNYNVFFILKILFVYFQSFKPYFALIFY